MFKLSTAFAAVALVGGGYLVWRKRATIQKGLDSIGVDTHFLDSGVGGRIESAASQVARKVKKGARAVKQEFNRESPSI